MSYTHTHTHSTHTHTQPLMQCPHDRDLGRTSISTHSAIAACAAPAPDHTQTHNPSPAHLPRVSIADATTQGEAGYRLAVSGPTSLSGDAIIFKNSHTHEAPCGECAFASYPEQFAETCIRIRPQEAPDEAKEIWEEKGGGKGEAIIDARGVRAAGPSDDVVCDAVNGDEGDVEGTQETRGATSQRQAPEA